jgi:hypothetical protein
MALRSATAAATAAVLVFALCCIGLAGAVPTGAASPFNRLVTLEGDGLGTVRIGISERAATRELSADLGTPSARPASGCGGPYRDVEWHDLIVQFKGGRFTGYRYWVAQPRVAVEPRLRTRRGITVGSTFGQLRRAYVLTQTGTDFWSAQGLTFGLSGLAYPSPPSAPVYEVKVTVCPAAL